MRIVGFYDGIRVGYNHAALSNVLMNVNGDTDRGCYPSCLTRVNVIHITANTVSDLSVMGVANAGGAHTTTIQDDLTGTTLPDASVGIYALGELAASGGYSRYTTSPNAATWISSATTPASGSCNSAASGSLYSYSNSTGSGNVLWVCPANLSTASWKLIK